MANRDWEHKRRLGGLNGSGGPGNEQHHQHNLFDALAATQALSEAREKHQEIAALQVIAANFELHGFLLTQEVVLSKNKRRMGIDEPVDESTLATLQYIATKLKDFAQSTDSLMESDQVLSFFSQAVEESAWNEQDQTLMKVAFYLEIFSSIISKVIFLLEYDFISPKGKLKVIEAIEAIDKVSTSFFSFLPDDVYHFSRKGNQSKFVRDAYGDGGYRMIEQILSRLANGEEYSPEMVRQIARQLTNGVS